MIKVICLTTAAVLLVLVPRTAHAYRPFDGTDGDVAELGEFELELGPLQMERVARHNYLLTPVTVLNLGILPRVELIVDFVGNVPLRPERGEGHYQLRDTDVFLKVLLLKGVLQQQSGPSIAVEAGPLTPEIAGDRGFGAAANVIVSEQFGWLLLHLNNIAALSRGDLAFSWSNTLITEFRFNETAWPVTELRWEREIRSGSSVYSALGGFIWSVAEGIDLDGAAMIGSVDGQPDFQARLGFTWATQFWGDPSEDPAGDEEKNAHASHGRPRSLSPLALSGIHGRSL
jgi:hypothetical protein